MKKKAFTLTEIIIAMSLVTILSILAINTLTQSTPDTDLMKFRHVYGTVSSAVSQILENGELYPTSAGFADTSSVTLRDSGEEYSGSTKFKKAFEEKFNIADDDVTVSGTSMPVYKLTSGSIKTVSKLTCFTNNGGTTFCPPETGTDGDLSSIYLRVHLDDSYDIANAIYFEIFADGKIEIPYQVQTGDNTYLINCMNSSHNSYYQCSIISSLDEI